ncbi:DUF58 domain-containing protein [Glutamicibacter sp.]|uniref:DUF58 domain-containing protein n=1 Tax=Glutamicibacter sp. TaxID=1931995 RepID=UPI0028BDF17B|nr:DUF58 domain-containing protein [Glutamicibacter sp.]
MSPRGRRSTKRAAKKPAASIATAAKASASLASEAYALLREVCEPWLRAAGALARRYLSPVSAVVSTLGLVVAATAVLLWILGASFGWQEALMGAFMATLLLLIAVVFVLGSHDYQVDLDLNRTRVAVGQRAVGALKVTNKANRTSGAVVMELPVGAGIAAFRIPQLGAGKDYEDLFTIPTHRRQVLQVGPVRSVRQDPFALLRRQVKWTGTFELFVHPKTTTLDATSAGFIRDLEGMPTKELSSSDVSFHALRDYEPGDDRRYIHWKSTARTGELMVRQFEQTRRSHLAVALSTNLDEYSGAQGEEDFELAVSVAASIGLQAALDQRKLEIMTQAGPVRTSTGRDMMDGLTRLQGAAIRKTLIDVVRGTVDAVPGVSVMFFVTGAGTTARALREAAKHVPFGVRAIAIRCGVGLQPAQARIGELNVLTLGQLDELGLMLRRAVA